MDEPRTSGPTQFELVFAPPRPPGPTLSLLEPPFHRRVLLGVKQLVLAEIGCSCIPRSLVTCVTWQRDRASRGARPSAFVFHSNKQIKGFTPGARRTRTIESLCRVRGAGFTLYTWCGVVRCVAELTQRLLQRCIAWRVQCETVLTKPCSK